MTRYIDREQLLELINENCKFKDPTNEYTIGCNEVCDWVIKTIKNIPTADVQEIRHGYWIEKNLDDFRKVECSCSMCGWSGVENYDSYVDIHDFEFCPYCGAKMDLGG